MKHARVQGPQAVEALLSRGATRDEGMALVLQILMMGECDALFGRYTLPHPTPTPPSWLSSVASHTVRHVCVATLLTWLFWFMTSSIRASSHARGRFRQSM